jgi:flavorubredoxin
MYGNTEMMMNAIAQGISMEGLPVEIFDAARTHSSYILPAMWKYKAVMIGAPTYEGNLFPPMVNLLEEAATKRIINKKCAYFGSYGWSGGALKHIKKIIEPAAWVLEDIYEFPGGPDSESLKKGLAFGRDFARKIKNM